MHEIPCEWSLNGDIIVGLPGRFNIYNGMCAACTGALLKMPEEVILHALEHVKCVAVWKMFRPAEDFPY